MPLALKSVAPVLCVDLDPCCRPRLIDSFIYSTKLTSTLLLLHRHLQQSTSSFGLFIHFNKACLHIIIDLYCLQIIFILRHYRPPASQHRLCLQLPTTITPSSDIFLYAVRSRIFCIVYSVLISLTCFCVCLGYCYGDEWCKFLCK